LQAYRQHIEQALQADAHRPKQARRTARVLFAEIRKLGNAGGYTRLTDFIRKLHLDAASKAIKAFVSLSFALGEAFQFDWSEEALVIGGIYRRLRWLCRATGQPQQYLFGQRGAQPLLGALRVGQSNGDRPAISQ
jgi:hypothetical protein